MSLFFSRGEMYMNFKVKYLIKLEHNELRKPQFTWDDVKIVGSVCVSQYKSCLPQNWKANLRRTRGIYSSNL